MNVFDHPDFDGHEHVSFFSDETAGLRAIVAIHSSAPFGLAGGGCRMWPYSSVDAALTDALRLSRAMSYKLALCEMPAGGAKTVVIADPAKDKSEALLRALGKAVERLGGRYIIAEDVGTNPNDMRIVGLETRYVVGQATDTGPATAHGVFVALSTAVLRKLERSDLKGLRVAVQGLGNVGRRLCEELVAAGATLVVADVDRERVARAVSELGARSVAPEAIYEQDADVFAPCALGGILDDETIPRLRALVVAGSANNQLASEHHAEALAARGILYVPDFVANAGGVIGAAQEGRGLGDRTPREGIYDESVAFRETERIRDILAKAFVIADGEGISPHRAAVRMAKEKIRQLRGGCGD
jgi:leucine dehydrogenase